jgi:hypothetical protein
LLTFHIFARLVWVVLAPIGHCPLWLLSRPCQKNIGFHFYYFAAAAATNSDSDDDEFRLEQIHRLEEKLQKLRRGTFKTQLIDYRRFLIILVGSNATAHIL